mmetsp:Transcript_35221/g.91464  ORF Transcript_35221/g.91464 Transcript_35221/m.91464 type:complete len:259 (-) Transcript_35221:177-953(-)
MFGETELGLLGGNTSLALLPGELLSIPGLAITGVLLCLLLNDRLGTDVLVNLLPHAFYFVGADACLNVLREYLLVLGFVLLLQVSHVVANVASEDVVPEPVRVKLLGLGVVTDETLLVVRHVHATIASTLEGTENPVTSGGAKETDIKEGLEGALLLTFLNKVQLSSGLLLTLVLLSKTELGKDTASKKETGGVCCGIVGRLKLSGEAVVLKLMSISRGDHFITLDLGNDDLADHILVGETDDEPELGRVVLVLVLSD